MPSYIPWVAIKHAAWPEDCLFGFFILGPSFTVRTTAKKTGLSLLANLLICWAVISYRDWDNGVLHRSTFVSFISSIDVSFV